MKNKSQKNRNPGAAVCSILGTVLLIIIILICIPISIPNLMGYHVYNVISGSMEPEIPVGSLVYVENVDPVDLVEGDVIAFYGTEEETGIVTHRIVENYLVGGTITTKGDANDIEDPMPVPYSNVIGRVTKSIPKLGTIAAIFDQANGKIYAVAGIAGAIVLIVIGGTLGERKR